MHAKPIILTAHQPVYLPWLGLFHKIALADMFCYFDDVQYETRGWNNRNKIIGSNGSSVMLTVPVLSKGHRGKSFCDIRINNEVSWQKKHWKSIYLNYKKTQFFEKYADNLISFYERKWDFLVDLNYEMLLYFLKELGIDIKIVKMSDYDFSGNKSDLVLDMCTQLKAGTYIFGELGEDYADKEAFSKKNVSLYFQKYKHPVYQQGSESFQPYLSIIDLLFNMGDDSRSVLLSENIEKNGLEKKLT